MNSCKQFQLHFDFYSTLVYPTNRVKKQQAASLIDPNLHVSRHRYLTDSTQFPTTRRKLLHPGFLACTVAEVPFSIFERERLLSPRLLEGVRSVLMPHCRGDDHES